MTVDLNHEEGEGRGSEACRQATREVLADVDLWALIAILLAVIALVS